MLYKNTYKIKNYHFIIFVLLKINKKNKNMKDYLITIEQIKIVSPMTKYSKVA